MNKAETCTDDVRLQWDAQWLNVLTQFRGKFVKYDRYNCLCFFKVALKLVFIKMFSSICSKTFKIVKRPF